MKPIPANLTNAGERIVTADDTHRCEAVVRREQREVKPHIKRPRPSSRLTDSEVLSLHFHINPETTNFVAFGMTYCADYIVECLPKPLTSSFVRACQI